MKLEFQKTLRNISQSKAFYHFLFWLFMLVFLIILSTSDDTLLLVITKNTINVSFFALLTYLNIAYLIPELLSKNRTLVYVLSLVGIAGLLTPVKIALFYLLHNSDPVSQAYYVQNFHLPFFELLLVGVASAIYKLFIDVLYHQSNNAELQKQNLTSELRFLKSQIDPHFFFNTLNSLYALTLKKSDDAPETVLKLSNMMRYMLYECNDRTVPLQKEIDYIKNYIDLESIRQNDQTDIKLEVEGDAQGKMIMPLVFSPFIENAFKHGLNTDIGSNFVHFYLKILEDHIFFKCTNSKSETDKPNNVGGIGLENVQRRLKLIYPENHTLRINNTSTTYTIDLYINIQNQTL